MNVTLTGKDISIMAMAIAVVLAGVFSEMALAAIAVIFAAAMWVNHDDDDYDEDDLISG